MVPAPLTTQPPTVALATNAHGLVPANVSVMAEVAIPVNVPGDRGHPEAERALRWSRVGTRGSPDTRVNVLAAAKETGQARGDRVVLVGSTGHRDEHTIEELVAALATLFGRK